MASSSARPPPRRRPHIPNHRGRLRHRQPRHHPRPPQSRNPTCRRAGALPARARRNRPRHRHGDPPAPHSRNSARASSAPGRATSRPASQAQSQTTPVAAPRLRQSRSLHAHTAGSRPSSTPSRGRPHHRRDLRRSRRRAGLCTPAFWNGLFELMHYFGSDRVVVTVMREKAHREQTFIQEQDKKLAAPWTGCI
jgi:hypothetical protein